MAEDILRYDVLVQEALRGVVRKVLAEVARTGLPGEHHFFITFDTRAPGVRLSSRLRAQYPQDMTVVLQNRFWDLSVTESAFEVMLSFGGVPERLSIPLRAMSSFVDPHAGFGVKFDAEPTQTAEAEGAAAANGPSPAEQPENAPAAEAAAEPSEGRAQVVSLDAFRKK